MNSSVSVNFKLTTNSRYIEEMEKSRPLSSEDEQFIAQTFKPEYVKPMQVYYLIASNGKRKKLMKFLHGDTTTERPPTTARIFQPTRREADLVVRSPRGSIDFNRGIFGQVRSKKVNQHKFESRGIHEDGIFGYARPYTAVPEEKSTLPVFLAKKLMTPLGLSRVENTLDDTANYQILTELVKWAEKRSNAYLIDPLRDDPELSPRAQLRQCKEKNSEDHMYPTQHRFYEPHPPASTLTRSGRAFKTNYTTAFQESFCDEMHQHLPTKVDPPIIPLRNNCPFAPFPTSGEKEEVYRSPFLQQNALTTYLDGKFNNQVFNSATCL